MDRNDPFARALRKAAMQVRIAVARKRLNNLRRDLAAIA